MKLTSLTDVRSILETLEKRPSKSLGQNFLVDENVLKILVREADVGPDHHVLEVGPGLGVVTLQLAQIARKVTAVEVDHLLAEHLSTTLPSNVSLIRADATDLAAAGVDLSEIDRFVSNLPYSVGSRIIADLVMGEHKPGRMVVTVQLEVAERLAARAGTGDYGLLGVWVQQAYEVEIAKKVSKTCFWPVPKVSSAIVTMKLRAEPEALSNSDEFYRLTKQAFSFRRKQIVTILGRILPDGGAQQGDLREFLGRLDIDPAARPGSIAVEDWCKLANALTP